MKQVDSQRCPVQSSEQQDSHLYLGYTLFDAWNMYQLPYMSTFSLLLYLLWKNILYDIMFQVQKFIYNVWILFKINANNYGSDEKLQET